MALDYRKCAEQIAANIGGGENVVSAAHCATRLRLVIADNGMGFDPDAVRSTGGTHIVISNVRERLAKLCGGTMEINSKPGEGTRIVLTIPIHKE